MQEETEDFSIEKDADLDDSVVAEEAQGETIKKLRERVKAAEGKAREYLDGWQRAQADFANMRRRDEEAKQEFLKFAKASLVEELIPVLDSFNIAVSQGHPEGKPPASFGAGADLEVLYRQLMDILRKNGLEELDPAGETFDPRLHEAVSSEPVDDPERDQKILKVLQKGYALSGKIIRPAKVIIQTHNG